MNTERSSSSGKMKHMVTGSFSKQTYEGQFDCAHCKVAVSAVSGRYSGVGYKVHGDQVVHEECFEAFRLAEAETCVHKQCLGPILRIEGKYDGNYYPVADGGKVHSECWRAYCRVTYPACLECKEPCCVWETDDRRHALECKDPSCVWQTSDKTREFSGQVLKFGDGQQCHNECFEMYQRKVVAKKGKSRGPVKKKAAQDLKMGSPPLAYEVEGDPEMSRPYSQSLPSVKEEPYRQPSVEQSHNLRFEVSAKCGVTRANKPEEQIEVVPVPIRTSPMPGKNKTPEMLDIERMQREAEEKLRDATKKLAEAAEQLAAANKAKSEADIALREAQRQRNEAELHLTSSKAKAAEHLGAAQKVHDDADAMLAAAQQAKQAADIELEEAKKILETQQKEYKEVMDQAEAERIAKQRIADLEIVEQKEKAQARAAAELLVAQQTKEEAEAYLLLISLRVQQQLLDAQRAKDEADAQLQAAGKVKSDADDELVRVRQKCELDMLAVRQANELAQNDREASRRQLNAEIDAARKEAKELADEQMEKAQKAKTEADRYRDMIKAQADEELLEAQRAKAEADLLLQQKQSEAALYLAKAQTTADAEVLDAKRMVLQKIEEELKAAETIKIEAQTYLVECTTKTQEQIAIARKMQDDADNYLRAAQKLRDEAEQDKLNIQQIRISAEQEIKLLWEKANEEILKARQAADLKILLDTQSKNDEIEELLRQAQRARKDADAELANAQAKAAEQISLADQAKAEANVLLAKTKISVEITVREAQQNAAMEILEAKQKAQEQANEELRNAEQAKNDAFSFRDLSRTKCTETVSTANQVLADAEAELNAAKKARADAEAELYKVRQQLDQQKKDAAEFKAKAEADLLESNQRHEVELRNLTKEAEDKKKLMENAAEKIKADAEKMRLLAETQAEEKNKEKKLAEEAAERTRLTAKELANHELQEAEKIVDEELLTEKALLQNKTKAELDRKTRETDAVNTKLRGQRDQSQQQLVQAQKTIASSEQKMLVVSVAKANDEKRLYPDPMLSVDLPAGARATAVFTGFEKGPDNEVLFNIEMSFQTVLKWTISHRHSDFVKLYQTLISEGRQPASEPAPKRLPLGLDGFDKNFQKERQDQLQEWLNAILKNTSILESRGLRIFVGAQEILISTRLINPDSELIPYLDTPKEEIVDAHLDRYQTNNPKLTHPICTHCGESVMRVDGKFSGVYSVFVGGKVHEECEEAYKMALAAKADKCAFCVNPIIEVKGRYDGSSYQTVDGKVHTECYESYKRSKSPACVHCTQPIFQHGTFSGDSRMFDDGQKVHEECYTTYMERTAPNCSFCSQKIYKVEGRFSGVQMTMPGTPGVVHEECFDQYKLVISDKCRHCAAPVTLISEKFSGVYYNTQEATGNFKVHKECWDAFQEAANNPPVAPDEETHRLDARVLSFEDATHTDGTKTHDFVVTVTTTRGATFTILRRYHDFETIYKTLKERGNFPTIRDFAFPPGRGGIGSLFTAAATTAKERREAFDDLCQRMVQLDPIPQVVLDFLQSDTRA